MLGPSDMNAQMKEAMLSWMCVNISDCLKCKDFHSLSHGCLKPMWSFLVSFLCFYLHPEQNAFIHLHQSKFLVAIYDYWPRWLSEFIISYECEYNTPNYPKPGSSSLWGPIQVQVLTKMGPVSAFICPKHITLTTIQEGYYLLAEKSQYFMKKKQNVKTKHTISQSDFLLSGNPCFCLLQTTSYSEIWTGNRPVAE